MTNPFEWLAVTETGEERRWEGADTGAADSVDRGDSREPILDRVDGLTDPVERGAELNQERLEILGPLIARFPLRRSLARRARRWVLDGAHLDAG